MDHHISLWFDHIFPILSLTNSSLKIRVNETKISDSLIYSIPYNLHSFTTASSICHLFMAEVIMTNAHQKCGKLHIRVSQSKKVEEKMYTNTKVCFCKLLIEYNLVETHSSSRHIILKQLSYATLYFIYPLIHDNYTAWIGYNIKYIQFVPWLGIFLFSFISWSL